MVKFICQICNFNSDVSDENLKWPRSYLRCLNCNSNVRSRSLYNSLLNLNLNLDKKKILQFSPSFNCPIDKLFKEKYEFYEISRYWEDIPNGSYKDGIKNLNLENLLLQDETYDLIITMDIFEHIYNPQKAITEIFRVLKKGGYYLMTVPIDGGINKTEKVFEIIDNNKKINNTKVGKFKGFINKLEYHGNPNDPAGSVVTYYWGYDILNFIVDNTNFEVKIDNLKDNLKYGITGVMNECIVCYKPTINEENNINNLKKISMSDLTSEKQKYYEKIK